MQNLFRKPRNIICIIVCLLVIILLLWQNYRWRQEYIESCKQNNIEISWRKMD